MKRFRAAIRWAAFTYLAGAIAATMLLRWTDAWDVATLVAFGPRWVGLLPAVPLLIAGWFDRRSLAVTAVGVAVVAIGFCNFAVGWPATPDRQSPLRLRVATFNTEIAKGLGPKFLQWLQTSPADVVLLQECSAESLERLGLSAGFRSATAAGGVGIFSRFPVESAEAFVEPGYFHGGGAAAFTVRTPACPVVFGNVHLPTPRDGLESMRYRSPSAWSDLRTVNELRSRRSAAVAAWLRSKPGPKVVAGDFNTPPESVFWRRDWHGLTDAFASAGWGWGTTKQTRWFGTRIDYILPDASWRVTGSRVGPDLGSDHRPVVAELELNR